MRKEIKKWIDKKGSSLFLLLIIGFIFAFSTGFGWILYILFPLYAISLIRIFISDVGLSETLYKMADHLEGTGPGDEEEEEDNSKVLL